MRKRRAKAQSRLLAREERKRKVGRQSSLRGLVGLAAVAQLEHVQPLAEREALSAVRIRER